MFRQASAAYLDGFFERLDNIKHMKSDSYFFSQTTFGGGGLKCDSNQIFTDVSVWTPWLLKSDFK